MTGVLPEARIVLHTEGHSLEVLCPMETPAPTLLVAEGFVPVKEKWAALREAARYSKVKAAAA